MSQGMPSFWNSKYFVPDPDNWHLTEDAPEDMKKEFQEYMAEAFPDSEEPEEDE